MNLDDLQVSREEHRLWLQMCDQLKELGAVTKQDLESKLSDQSTAGQRLLSLIRTWGDARVVLEEANVRSKMKAVFTIVGSDSKKPVFRRIGTGLVNQDNSLNVFLDALPVSGKLHIRDIESIDKNGPDTSNEEA